MRVLVIGSVTADVVLQVPALPQAGEDLNVTAWQMALGGCACNVAYALGLFGVQADLCAPVGQGYYGEFVRRQLAQRGIASLLPPAEGQNGCCYCLVDPSGERSFLCCRGAEYRFRADWLQGLPAGYDAAYFCGLELEEPTGSLLLDYLEGAGIPQLYFAPGLRLRQIPPQRLERAWQLRPRVHLNEQEALAATGAPDWRRAAQALAQKTGREVLVTLGSRGAYVERGAGSFFKKASPAVVVDTIGAGDGHMGAWMAGLLQGMEMEQAVEQANRYAAAVVSQAGAMPAAPW